MKSILKNPFFRLICISILASFFILSFELSNRNELTKKQDDALANGNLNEAAYYQSKINKNLFNMITQPRSNTYATEDEWRTGLKKDKSGIFAIRTYAKDKNCENLLPYDINTALIKDRISTGNGMFVQKDHNNRIFVVQYVHDLEYAKKSITLFQSLSCVSKVYYYNLGEYSF